MALRPISSFCNIDFLSKLSALSVALLLALIVSFGAVQLASAQQTTASLNGTVLDVSGATVADATVTLKNEASGDTRATVSNSDGYFVFTAVPPASYSLSVEMAGFKVWQAKGIVLNSADKRNVIGIKLQPGLKSETVVVEAADTSITPVDSGEKSALITEHILKNVAIVGQNAGEFLKILPGMAFTGGVVNQSSVQSKDESTGNGVVGNLSANGTRVGALDITSDGAHIIDPGCNCGQAMNTNVEMTSELKVMTSNFGADEAKGPVTANFIGKSGGNQFHGEVYFYARHYSMNANDPQNKDAGLAKAPAKYYFPGGQIGGPILLPKTDFNRNRDKLFFFFATQYYKQDIDQGVYHAVVPTGPNSPGTTMNMRAGDFSDANYLSHLNGYALGGVPNGGGPGGNAFTNGILTNNPDTTGTGQALINVYPLPNQNPITFPGGWNYAAGATKPSNFIQYRGKVDYTISQSTKLAVSYNHENDNATNSLDVLWGSGGNSWAAPTTPYPSSIGEKTQSDVVTANLTKVFSPTLTNELVFSYTYLNLPNSFNDRSKVERKSLGINYNLLFSHPNPDNIIFPQLTGWGDGISNMLNTGFELNGTVYAKKTLPTVSDNLSKVWKTHTTKFGFYWERTWNEQPGNGSVNGSAVFSNWGGGSSGNAYADMLIGQTTQYTEQNFDVVPAFRYLTAEFYATDSWKVSRRLTLDYGMRFSHLGPWVDNTGFGFGAWYPDLFAAGTGGSAGGVNFPGIEWNKVHSSTPLSGSGSRAFFYNPRAGFAYDVFGTGRTVLRGGYGIYHFHDEQNVQNGAYGIVQGSFAVTNSGQNFSQLQPITSVSGAVPGGVTALDPNDSEQPRTQSYSFTIAQRLPWKSQLEVAYVGSKSDYLSNYNNNFGQLNDVSQNTLFGAYGWLPNYTCTASPCPQGTTDSSYGTNRENAVRPLNTIQPVYGTLKLINHQMYSNYNGLQVTWNKQAGHLTFLTNYTFSKALGIRGENGSATGNPLSLKDNYGTLPNNRTHIFNVAYVYEVPELRSANAFAKAAVNGWQISGILQYQSGADLQAIGANGSNFGYSGFIPAQTTFMGKTNPEAVQASSDNTLGTPDITLMPVLTCNPATGLGPNQYVNAACFSSKVTPGVQGTYIFPSIIGPGFFNTDLSLFKNFTFGASESKKLQFRVSGYNFLNHPNRTFINGDPNLTLAFQSDGTLKSANSRFGFADNTIGHRIMQLSVKFSF